MQRSMIQTRAKLSNVILWLLYSYIFFYADLYIKTQTGKLAAGHSSSKRIFEAKHSLTGSCCLTSNQEFNLHTIWGEKLYAVFAFELLLNSVLCTDKY